MRTLSLARGAFAVGSLVLAAASPASAQTAKTVLSKFSQTYNTAKTYQATFVATVMMAQTNTNMNMNIKMAGSKVRMDATAQTPNGPMNIVQLDDGKNMYRLIGTTSYTKGPHDPRFAAQAMGMPSPQELAKASANFKLLPATSVNGKSAYALVTTGPQAMGGTLTMFIDKASYHLLQMKMSNPQGVNMTMNVKNEVFNPNLPASVFVFTPPKGAKLVQGGGGMMGGMGK